MDHTYIEEHSFIERYHQGQLEPAEEMLFEAHFVDCAQCTEQLELARGFRLGMRAVAAEEGARVEGLVRAGILAHLARRARGWPMGLAMAAVLTVALATVFWVGMPGSPDSAAVQPLANAPVFILSTVRSTQDATVLDLGENEWATVAIDVDDDPRFETYRIIVEDADGVELWRRDDLLPNTLEMLMVTFPSSFFAPGEYRLTLEGLPSDGPAVPIESYPFEVGVGR